MTQVPEQHAGGGVPATEHQWTSTGLEDFSVTDAVLPRIKIDHQNGTWVDNLGGVQMPTLRFIALGLVKQRVLFHHVVENEDVPMCKSADYQSGFPNPDAPSNKSFPWQLSGFDKNDYPPDAEGNVKLPCDGCALKDWGSHPANDNPYCSEQWTLPIYYDGSQDGSGEWSPAILTLQKSSIKPIRTYFTQFAQSNKPPFLAIGRGTLKVNTRGSVTYSVPSFSKEGESPRDRWMEFSEQFTEMRSFLVRPPVREQDGTAGQAPAAPQNNEYSGPPQQAAPAPAAEPQQAPPQQQPPQQAAPIEDPWNPPAPAQQAPPQQQPPQQQPPQQQPPQQQPPQQQPPQQQPPQQAPPAPAGQGLPF